MSVSACWSCCCLLPCPLRHGRSKARGPRPFSIHSVAPPQPHTSPLNTMTPFCSLPAPTVPRVSGTWPSGGRPVPWQCPYWLAGSAAAAVMVQGVLV